MPVLLRVKGFDNSYNHRLAPGRNQDHRYNAFRTVPGIEEVLKRCQTSFLLQSLAKLQVWVINPFFFFLAYTVNDNLFSHGSGNWEVEDRGASRFGV